MLVRTKVKNGFEGGYWQEMGPKSLFRKHGSRFENRSAHLGNVKLEMSEHSHSDSIEIHSPSLLHPFPLLVHRTIPNRGDHHPPLTKSLIATATLCQIPSASRVEKVHRSACDVLVKSCASWRHPPSAARSMGRRPPSVARSVAGSPLATGSTFGIMGRSQE